MKKHKLFAGRAFKKKKSKGFKKVVAISEDKDVVRIEIFKAVTTMNYNQFGICVHFKNGSALELFYEDDDKGVFGNAC